MHFLIETLCVSIVTLPTLRGKSVVFPLAYGAGVRSPSEAGQARPPERLPFSMAFRSSEVHLLQVHAKSPSQKGFLHLAVGVCIGQAAMPTRSGHVQSSALLVRRPVQTVIFPRLRPIDHGTYHHAQMAHGQC